jgi:hypothetical protein
MHCNRPRPLPVPDKFFFFTTTAELLSNVNCVDAMSLNKVRFYKGGNTFETLNAFI